MSGTWNYVGTATSIKDWTENSPWQTDVGDLLSEGGAEVTFETTEEENQLSVTITPADGSGRQEGLATYQPDGSVVGQFENDGAPYLLVTSLAQVADDDNTEWHLYALLMKDDPDNVAVIGGQGSG